jgi:glycosyltransferase A (GT-A) superfamily protein (DUF2064 family)
LYQGKQRLAETIGAEKALVFAQLLLNCAVEDLNGWQGKVVISPSHDGDQQWATDLLSKATLVIPQVAGNLGERLNSLDRQLRELGHQQIIYIGSDAPILTAQDYLQIIDALKNHDVALSPALDGGVTMMASNKPWPDMRDLPWSTAQLGASLEQLCKQQDSTVAKTSPTYDIDTEQQLVQLTQDLAQDKRPARQDLFKQINILIKAAHYA